MAVDHGHSSVVTPGKALLSGYYALGKEAKFPGHNTLTAVLSPIQIKLSLDNSSDSRPVKKRTKR
jgi:hypothetical protein